MAKQSKNDQSLRALLLKSGNINQGVQAAKPRDLKASQAQAIAARRAEMNRASQPAQVGA